MMEQEDANKSGKARRYGDINLDQLIWGTTAVDIQTI